MHVKTTLVNWLKLCITELKNVNITQNQHEKDDKAMHFPESKNKITLWFKETVGFLESATSLISPIIFFLPNKLQAFDIQQFDLKSAF